MAKQTFKTPLNFQEVETGSVEDNVLVRDVDGNVKEIPRSEFGGGEISPISGTPNTISKFNSEGDGLIDSAVSDDGSKVNIALQTEIDSQNDNKSGLRFNRLKNDELTSDYGTASLFADSINTPKSITFGWDSNIYVSTGDNEVMKITQDGIVTENHATGANPQSILFTFNYAIYTANFDDNTVTRSQIYEGVSSFNVNSPHSLVYRPSSGNTNYVYVTNYDDDTVTLISPTGDISVFGTTGANPTKILIDSDTSNFNLFIINSGDGTVTKITKDGVSSIFCDSLNNPVDLVMDSMNNLYILNAGDKNVIKVTPLGVSSILGSSGNNPTSITINPYNSTNDIFITNYDDNTVTKLTQTGVSSVYAETGEGPIDIVAYGFDPRIMFVANELDNSITKITLGVMNKRLLTLDEFGNVIKNDEEISIKIIDEKIAKAVIPILENSTSIALSAATLDSTYPDSVTGFKVHCVAISTGGLTYEKTSTGWIQHPISEVS